MKSIKFLGIIILCISFLSCGSNLMKYENVDELVPLLVARVQALEGHQGIEALAVGLESIAVRRLGLLNRLLHLAVAPGLHIYRHPQAYANRQ